VCHIVFYHTPHQPKLPPPQRPLQGAMRLNPNRQGSGSLTSSKFGFSDSELSEFRRREADDGWTWTPENMSVKNENSSALAT
jgi:hypothetical protein